MIARAIAFVAVALLALLALYCIGDDRHPLAVDASDCKPLPNPCDRIDCNRATVRETTRLT